MGFSWNSCGIFFLGILPLIPSAIYPIKFTRISPGVSAWILFVPSETSKGIILSDSCGDFVRIATSKIHPGISTRKSLKDFSRDSFRNSFRNYFRNSSWDFFKYPSSDSSRNHVRADKIE